MKTKQQIIKQIMALSFLILLMMGLLGCGSMEVGALPADDASANDGETEEVQVKAIEVGIEPTPMPETLSYTNDFYGFKFDYPETWSLTEEDHGVVLKKGTNRLGINFRWINENIQPKRTGMGGDSLIYSDKISFMGQIVPGYIVELDRLAKAYLLGDTSRIEIDDLSFAIILEDLETDYMTLDLSEEIIAEAITILETFEQIEATGLPPEDVLIPEPNGSPPETTIVVAWLGHIASLPEGSQYDDFVILSPQGTGEFGLTGATQEIEAEIRTLRDADGPSEYVHLWGMLSCDVEDYNGCQIAVDRLQNGYRNGPQYSEGEVVDGWMGTITASTFNMGTAYVFELLGTFPMWYGIDASQDESLQAQIESLRDTGAVVKVSGKLMVGIPDVNGTRIEVSELDVIEAGPEEQPALVDTFDPTADWPVFINDRYGYQIKTPREATITLYGPMGFMPDDVPDGMTGDQYMDQLQKTLTDRLCVYIEYSLGFIYISAPPNQEKLYVHCGIPAPGAGDHIAKIEMVGIGDQLYQANGMEWISGGPSPSGETLDLHSETFWIDLDDGTRIAYGATYRTDATYEDYLMKTKEMLLQILATFEAMP